MELGRRLGCHQMPERSVFVGGYQFPVCARCMGVIPASLIATAVFFWYRLTIFVSLVFCGIMFLDWFIQRINICQSTNLRRFITGLMGGYGFTTLELHLLRGFILVMKMMVSIY